MSAKHKVYLGIPGVKFCWGTVTGVVTSTKKHEVRPYNGGLGFSGVVDFNTLWTDAHNLYDKGEITHFAMLHGDISPDPSQRWLDILLDVMDRRGAAVVSAVSPIKDMRGLSSSGICDPSIGSNWRAFRRFTQREILNDLPQEFDHVAAGYPDKPLLHNTAMWVCDMSTPAFHETNADGTLKLIFRFPERILRQNGEWAKEQESEDWLLSRELWDAGVKNTWITSEPRLTHHGSISFPNWESDFGKFKDGDENTEASWRPEQDAKPLSVTQILEFELGSKCNLGHEHKKCPTSYSERWDWLDISTELDDDTIVNSAVEAYRDLGFTGLIGWIYYNEPLLQMERMFSLMDRIKAEAPRARFILWTNGYFVPEDCERFNAFSQIVVSNYGEKSGAGYLRLQAANLNCDTLRLLENPAPHQGQPILLDERMQVIEPTDKSASCLRPFTEFIVDYYGNVHLCCYDWQGKASPGNIFADGFAEVAKTWREMLPDICGDKMTAGAPRFCQDCGHRWVKRHQFHDERVIKRAERWRKMLRDKEPAG